MIYNSKKHHRRSIRLNNYDYSNTGFYFITICTQNQSCLFGKIENEELLLNDAGAMIQAQWINLISRYTQIKLHEFIVMPNHFHGIIEFVGVPLVGTRNTKDSQTAGQPQWLAPTVGDVMGAFKSLSTNEYISGVKNSGWLPFIKKMWQRNYYEHIIRNEKSYLEIAEYIQSNHLKWQNDKYYCL